MPLQIIDTWTQTSNVPGVAAAVIGPDGELESRLAGAVTSSSLFALASLTKPLVATAVMIAVEEGALELDAPVAEYLPQYREPGPANHHSPAPVVPRLRAARGRSPRRRGGRRRARVPARDPQDLLQRGVRGAGRVDRAATGIRSRRRTCARRCSSRWGWTRFWAFPRTSMGGRWMCASRACAGSGVALFNSAEWRAARAPPPGVHLPPPRHMRGLSSCCSPIAARR